MTHERNDAPKPNERLIQAVRDLNVDAALAHLSETETDEVLAQMAKLRAALTPARERLDRNPFEGPHWLKQQGGGEWGTGLFNPTQPQLRMQISGSENEVRATWQSTVLDEGPPDMVHGGVSAFLLDMISGTLIQSMGIRAVTGKLNLTYRKKVPLCEPVNLVATLASVGGRRHVVRGEILVDGQVAVESEGIFITI